MQKGRTSPRNPNRNPASRTQLGGSLPKESVRLEINGMPLDITGLSPHKKDRMKPLDKRAREGRANPKGIAVLYLATNPETAIGEVRPWIRAYVSVSLFSVCRELRVVDCTKQQPQCPPSEQPAIPDAEEIVWRFINIAFSQPITPDDELADYAPLRSSPKSSERLGLMASLIIVHLAVRDTISCYSILRPRKQSNANYTWSKPSCLRARNSERQLIIDEGVESGFQMGILGTCYSFSVLCRQWNRCSIAPLARRGFIAFRPPRILTTTGDCSSDQERL